jgi:hypothetical protein
VDDRRVPIAAPVTVCALLLVAAAVMTAQGLALAGDGSYYLVRILGSGRVFPGLDARVLANVVREAPVLTLVHASVADTHTLTLALGAGQLVLPATLWATAILLARADRLAYVAVALTATLCAASTWMFNVSEAVLAAPLTALVAVLLWQPRWRWPHASLAVASSLVLVATYEPAVLTGTLFAGWAVWRHRRDTGAVGRIGSLAVAVLSVLSMITPFAGFAAQGPRGANNIVYHLVSLDPGGLFVALAGAALLVGSMAALRPGRPRLGLAIAGVVLLAAGVVTLDLTMGSAFSARGGSLLAAMVLAAFLFWQWASGAQGTNEAPGWVMAVPVVFAATSVGLLLVASTEWAHSLDAFRAEVNRGSGIAVARSVLPENRRQVLWDWPEPSLSLVVRSTPSSRVLVASDPSYVPFAPEQARDRIDDAYVWGR